MTPIGLGRGLDALLPPEEEGIRQLPVDRIEPNPEQPRRRIDPEGLKALAASIREHGVLQPLIVSEVAPGRYVLIAGERRWRAARMAGLETVPALIREATPRQRLELALIENLQRDDLDPLEEAEAYRELAERFGLTQAQIAERVGKSRSAVANALRLLQLPDPIRASLAAGEITAGHARAILMVEDREGQLLLWRRIRAEGLSVRQAEALARRLAGGAPRPRVRRASRLSPLHRQIQEALQRRLEAKVELKPRRKGGAIVLHYHDEEELAALLERLGVELE